MTQAINESELSIVIPCKNEGQSLVTLIPEIKKLHPAAELIIVNDGSTDNTGDICASNDVIEVKHAYSKGNGAAVKSGARRATGEFIVFMDGDGQHRPEDISKLIDEANKGFDLVVAARHKSSQASSARWLANTFYNKFSSWMVGHTIRDLTSGFRLVRAEYFRDILHLLPNGFSYPTTSTMAFFRYGYSVSYVDIDVKERIGNSHINILKDGIRFLLIIFKVGTLYSPLKLFTPISFLFFLLATVRYVETFITVGEFTNMSALLYSTSIIIFLIGLVSEQVTMLIYSNNNRQ